MGSSFDEALRVADGAPSRRNSLLDGSQGARGPKQSKSRCPSASHSRISRVIGDTQCADVNELYTSLGVRELCGKY